MVLEPAPTVVTDAAPRFDQGRHRRVQLGIFSSGIFSPMGGFSGEAFPTEIRGTAQGFVYDFGRAIGALFPSLIGYLSAKVGLGTAIGLFTVGASPMSGLAAVS